MPLRRSPRPSRALPSLLPVLLVMTVLTACGGGSGSAGRTTEPAPAGPTATESPAVERYVALGDSYTSAPGVPLTDVADGCFRSDGNYPSQVAEELGAELTDVSCAGADTADLYRDQLQGVPPQIDAVTSAADLVTVSLGGNDGQVFQTLVARCQSVAPGPGASAPTGRTCPQAIDDGVRDRLLATLQQTGDRLADALRAVQERAPQAQVLAIGYPTIVSADDRCDLLPLTASDQAYAAELNVALDDAVRRAAEAAGATYVDVATPTRGHDICADDPWVNGIVTDSRRAIAFHPFAAEQEAVAAAVLDAVRR